MRRGHAIDLLDSGSVVFLGMDLQRIEGKLLSVRIRIANTGFLVTVCPAGKIDAVTCPELQAAVNGLIDDGVTRIVLDLEDTVYISSAGLRVILNAAKRLHGSGQIVIAGVADDVRNILNVAGIPNVIDVYPDFNSAQAAFIRQ